MSKFNIDITVKEFIRRALESRKFNQSVNSIEELLDVTVLELFGADADSKDVSKRMVMFSLSEEVEKLLKKVAIKQIKLESTGQMLLPGQAKFQGPRVPRNIFINGEAVYYLKLNFVHILNYWRRKLTDGEVLENKHRNAMIEQIEKNEEAKIEIELTEECIKTIIAAGYNPEELTVEEARAITKKESEKVPA